MNADELYRRLFNIFSRSRRKLWKKEELLMKIQEIYIGQLESATMTVALGKSLIKIVE